PEPIKWSLWAVDGIVKPISRAQELENYRNKNRRAANSKKLKSTRLNFTQCEENDASRGVIESQQMDGTDCVDLDGKSFSFEQRQQTSFEESNNDRTISDAVACPFDAEAFGAHSVMDGDEQLVSMLGLAYQLDGTIVSDVMETFDSTLTGEGDYTNDVTNTCCSTINGEGGHVENSSNDVVNAFWDTFCSTINEEAGHAENDSNDVVNAFCSVENQAGIEDETGTCVGQQNAFDSVTNEEHDEDYTETRDDQQNMFNSVEAGVKDDTEIRDDTEMRVDQQSAFDLVGNEERVEDETEPRDDHLQTNSRPDEVCDEFCGDQSLRVPYSPLNANEYDDEIEEGEVVDDAEDNRTVSDNQQNWCEHGSATFEASLDEGKQQQKWEEQQADERIETGTMFSAERLVSREEEVGDNDFGLRVSVPAPMTPPRPATPTDEQRIPSPKTPPLHWSSYRPCIKMLQRREKRGKTNVLDVITLDEEYDL
uniref:RING-type domain-containing protein n=1 Tax=Globodera pallida TaxID=36090 RepID=A0A183CK12_GLOPA